MEICTSWSREEIIRAQKDDPNIPFVMHGSSRPETPARYEAENPENGELPPWAVTRAGVRMLIGGVYIHIFRFCPTSFFCNKVDFKGN